MLPEALAALGAEWGEVPDGDNHDDGPIQRLLQVAPDDATDAGSDRHSWSTLAMVSSQAAGPQQAPRLQPAGKRVGENSGRAGAQAAAGALQERKPLLTRPAVLLLARGEWRQAEADNAERGVVRLQANPWARIVSAAGTGRPPRTPELMPMRAEARLRMGCVGVRAALMPSAPSPSPGASCLPLRSPLWRTVACCDAIRAACGCYEGGA